MQMISLLIINRITRIIEKLNTVAIKKGAFIKNQSNKFNEKF